MSMATLQFYKNPWHYPNYGSITAYGNSMQCTPVGTGLKSGKIKVKGDMADFMSCNYLRLSRNGKSIYAWIEDVVFSTANSFEVSYRVDPWRTYRNNIDLGVQFIKRHPHTTSQLDPLLGSTQAYPDISTKTIPKTPNVNSRVFVVQVRPNGGTYSNTPVQPSPYQFYMCAYQANQWMNTQALFDLMFTLQGEAEPQNIVTMYSIPYMDISGLSEQPLIIQTADDSHTIEGWKLLGQHNNVTSLLSREIPISIDEDINALLRVEHSVQVVIPEAGILDIPDELLKQPDLKIREDIDLFSGASNFMVMSGENKYYNLSVRGSSISSIPIVSDPMDTYLSQNQNALATSLIGDVASIAGGVATAVGSGGLGTALGGSTIASGVTNIISRQAGIKDAGNKYSNPPAFLGTALAGAFNNRIWVVVTKQAVDNASTVHSNFGYPLNKVTNLVFPSSGFIQTEGCAVASDGTVPQWAIDEINTLFNNGIYVQ